MKNMQLLLLMILTQVAFVQAAQESKSGYDSDSDTVQSFKRRRLDSPVNEQPIESTLVAVPTVADVPVVDQERQDFIKRMTENYSVLDQGLNLLRKKGKKIERFDRFIDKKLEIETDDENAEINQNRIDFGMLIGQVEDVLLANMRDPFLRSLDDVIVSSNYDIQEEIENSNDPILQYVMQYKDGVLQPMIKKWVNHQDDFRATLLYKSALTGDENAVEFLLSLGADPNIENENERVPLHEVACFFDGQIIIKMLFDAGAKLDIQDSHGQTAIYEAFVRKNMDVVKLLYKLGANPTIINDNGDFDNLDSMIPMRDDYCNRHYDVLYTAYKKNCELRTAIINHNRAEVESLIMQGADVNFLLQQEHIFNLIRQRNMSSAIFFNQYDNDFLMFMIFSQNQYNFSYATNLQVACTNKDYLEIAKLLLEAGARPNKRFRQHYETSLHAAVKLLSPEHVKLLIQYGADVNLTEGNGYTALSFALQDYQDAPEVKREIIELLLEADAVESLNIVDRNNETPLIRLVENNNIVLLRMLLKYSPDVNFIDRNNENNGDSLLHRASRNNHIEIAGLLLMQQGIDTSIKNVAGQTALDVATTDEMREFLQ